MVQLIFLLDPTQDRYRVFDGWLLHDHRLEPAGQRGVFFNVFAIFIERRGPHTVELPPRKRRFDQVGRIHRAIRFPRPHERMHLVDEKDDFTCCRFNFFENGFETFLKFAAILRARNQCAHVEGEQLFVAQGFRHVTVDNPQGEPFGNRGFAHARLTDQHRVVLCSS